MGRVGVITHRERHDGGFNIVHIKDAIDNSFATRESNVFVIGREKPWISLPKGKGVKVQHRYSIAPKLVPKLTIYSTAFYRRGERSSSSLRHCRPLEVGIAGWQICGPGLARKYVLSPGLWSATEV